MKKVLFLTFALAASVAAHPQDGFWGRIVPVGTDVDRQISLYAGFDIWDLSFQTMANYNMKFVPNAGIGVRWGYTFNDRLSVGLSVGFAWWNYSSFSTFEDYRRPSVSASVAYEELRNYSSPNIVSLPIELDAKWYFGDWAANAGWDAVPMVTARMGYMVNMQSIHCIGYDKLTQITPLPGDTWTGTETTKYDDYYVHQGMSFAFGAGIRYRNLEVCPEVRFLPYAILNNHKQTTVSATGVVEAESETSYRGAGPAGDGFALRLVYNFTPKRLR